MKRDLTACLPRFTVVGQLLLGSVALLFKGLMEVGSNAGQSGVQKRPWSEELHRAANGASPRFIAAFQPRLFYTLGVSKPWSNDR